MLILTKNNLVLDTDDMLFEEPDEAYLKHALELGVSIQGVELANCALCYPDWRMLERKKFNNRLNNFLAVDDDGLLTHILGFMPEPMLLTQYCRGISPKLSIDIDSDYPLIFTSDLVLPDTFSLELSDSVLIDTDFDLTNLGTNPFVSIFCREYFNQMYRNDMLLGKGSIQHEDRLKCDRGIFIESVLTAFLEYGYALFMNDVAPVLSEYSDEACMVYKSLYLAGLFEIPKYARNSGIYLPYINDLSKSELTKLSKALYKSEALQGIVDTLILFVEVFNIPADLQAEILKVLRS